MTRPGNIFEVVIPVIVVFIVIITITCHLNMVAVWLVYEVTISVFIINHKVVAIFGHMIVLTIDIVCFIFVLVVHLFVTLGFVSSWQVFEEGIDIFKVVTERGWTDPLKILLDFH